MKRLLVLIVLFINSAFGQGPDSWGVKISNYITGKPVVTYHQLFYSNFHPGIEAEFNWRINKNDKHVLYTSANLGVYYHRFIHTGVKIYPEFNYNYCFSKKWSAFAGLGGGYLHSFENVAVLRLNSNGSYDKISSIVGRPQFMVGFDLGFSYTPEKMKGMSLITSFSTFLQGPFVSGYVPLLPYNMFNLGFTKPIKTKEK